MFSLQRLLLQSKKRTEILIGISLTMQMAHSPKVQQGESSLVQLLTAGATQLWLRGYLMSE